MVGGNSTGSIAVHVCMYVMVEVIKRSGWCMVVIIVVEGEWLVVYSNGGMEEKKKEKLKTASTTGAE